MHSNSWAKVYIISPQVLLLASLIKPHQLTVTIECDDGFWNLKQKMNTHMNIFSQFYSELLTPFIITSPSQAGLSCSSWPLFFFSFHPPLFSFHRDCCSFLAVLRADLYSPCAMRWSSEDSSDLVITSEELPPLQKTPELSGTPISLWVLTLPSCELDLFICLMGISPRIY